jgi:imidazole glycerol phosphate synthase glutamine amidotransferase subunit
VISIFDYGGGNLQSVQNTLGAIGAGYRVVRDANEVREAGALILPGVGHFGQMMRALAASGVDAAIKDRIGAGVPFLGICLGLQAMFEGSEEAPELSGFALFKGRVRRFCGEARVPHMGWNSLARVKQSKLLEGTGEEPYLYFANSYYAPVVDATAASCSYGAEFTAVLEKDNVFGVQFHPEKSGPSGLRVVRNFVGACS